MDKQEHRYDNTLSLTNKELGEALTDPAFDAKRDFGEKVYNDLVAEAGRRLKVNHPDDGPTGKSRGIPEISRRPGAYFIAIEKTADSNEWWHEFESKEERDKFIMERRIWTHYDHAREKHPYFCDTLLPFGMKRFPDFWEDLLKGSRGELSEYTKGGCVPAKSAYNCELSEMEAAIAHNDTPAAIEKCYDVIAVLLRVIDVLEGRQPLGKPAPETPKEPTPPPKSSAAPETERKGKTADGNYEYPPIDPDCGVMFCRCPGHEPGCAVCMMCKDWREYRNRYIRNVNDGLPEYKRPHRDAGLLTDEMSDMACEFIKYLLKVGQYG